MAIIFDCLHILGILFSMKHVLSSVCNHLCALGPRFFSCSTSMSSMPAALLFLSAAIPFLYSSSLNADTNDGSPSTVGSAGHLCIRHMNLSWFSGISSISSMASSKSVEKSSHLAFLRLKRLLNGVGCGTITGWTLDSHTDRAVLSAGDWIQNRLLTHIRNV